MEILLILVCIMIYFSIDGKEDCDAEPTYDYAEAKH